MFDFRSIVVRQKSREAVGDVRAQLVSPPAAAATDRRDKDTSLVSRTTLPLAAARDSRYETHQHARSTRHSK